MRWIALALLVACSKPDDCERLIKKVASGGVLPVSLTVFGSTLYVATTLSETGRERFHAIPVPNVFVHDSCRPTPRPP